jgi:hypothetical protein
MTCPQCGRIQHVVCNNRDCQCYRDIPAGELPQINVGEHDCCVCPYCEFIEHIDFWFERSMADYAAKATV